MEDNEGINYIVLLAFRSNLQEILISKNEQGEWRLPDISISNLDIPYDGLKILAQLTGIPYELKDIKKLPEDYRIEEDNYQVYLLEKVSRDVEVGEDFNWIDVKTAHNRFNNPLTTNMIKDAIYFLQQKESE